MTYLYYKIKEVHMSTIQNDNAILKAIKERRSIRSFKNEKVDRAVMQSIVEVSRFAPSWANTQIIRYTIVDDKNIIQQIGNNAVNGFTYNTNTLANAPGLAVLSYVQGRSGKLSQNDYATSKGAEWEMFDAGIACQSFCLASHAKGVGTVIMGVIDDERISTILNLPKDQKVAAIIAYGYPNESPAPSPRHDTAALMKFV
jgi:nitroreductase